MEENSTSNHCLPNDIISEILCRLPVKTLIRFCCVCKFWRNFITSDHVFIRYHHLQQSSIHCSNGLRSKEIIMYGARGSGNCHCISIPHNQMQKFVIADHETSFNPPSFLGMDKLVLIGCTNGVLCFYQGCRCLSKFDLCLWNPALHQFSILPDTNKSTGYYQIAIGFGFDHVNDDKVVKICLDCKIYKIEIYSLRNNSWKEICLKSVPFCIINSAGDSNLMGVVHHGFLHWIARDSKENCFYLAAFDMAREIFRMISYPGNVFFLPHLGLFQGCLCISGYTNGKIRFEIWIMKEYGVESSWIKQFVLPQSLNISPLNPLNTTTITAGGKILARQDDYVVLYDLKSQRVKPLQNGRMVSYLHDCCYFLVDNYVESLVSVGPCYGKLHAQIPNGGDKKEEQNSKSYLNKLLGCFVCRK